jgi:hypothetical protein
MIWHAVSFSNDLCPNTQLLISNENDEPKLGSDDCDELDDTPRVAAEIFGYIV